MSRYYKINNYDTGNGPGLRVTIFLTGCDFHCEGCFNKEIWSFNTGQEITESFYKDKIKPLINEHISGISILGGEPLHPKNIKATLDIIHSFKRDFPGKSVWIWSGYTYEELISEEYELSLDLEDYLASSNIQILKIADVLVDGKFINSKKDLRLKWRGSSNQRVIDLKKSKKEAVLFNG